MFSSNSFFQHKIFWMACFLVLVSFLFGSCSSDTQNISLEKSVQAQSNPAGENKATTKKINFLDDSVDLCRFKLVGIGFGEKEGDKEIYELMKAGFPEDTSIENGIAIFNKLEKCYNTGQPPLTVKEVKEALNREVCEKYTRINDTNLCYKRKRILEEGNLLKGSFLESGTMETDKNVANPEGIWLMMELDKHRNDMKGELVFPFLIKKYRDISKSNSVPKTK